MTDKEEREKVINDLELIKQSVADKELQESLTYAIESIKVDIFYDLMHEKITKCQQEPFINKPCVSSGVCEHDKNKVLDKIRAEIANDWQIHKYPSSPFSCGLRRAIEIIDKYAESED